MELSAYARKVHMIGNKKKFTFFRKIFFSSSEKLTFDKENVIFLNIFFKFEFI